MINFIKLFIAVVIILIIYLSYVFYNNYKNSKLEDEIVIKAQPEGFKNKEKPNVIETKKENNLLMKISKGRNVYNVELKLYDDITPLTCKNFRFIAKKGINGKSYNNCIFHRVIRDFMIQGGDIVNGDGTGSVSIYGNQFEDENFKIKHSKPYLLSMANSGPNTNGSQFFITTVPTPHLDNKHVVFGEVINGMNIIKEIEGSSTDSSDKPYEDIKIISINEI